MGTQGDAIMRVAVLFTCWMIFWMSLGTALGAVFGLPKTGTIDGFIFAMVAVFTWPWLMPKFIDHWLDDGDNQPS